MQHSIFENVRFLNEKFFGINEINVVINSLKSAKILFGKFDIKDIDDAQGFHISFNMNREQIRNSISMNYKTFKKVYSSVDDYRLFHIYYDNEDNFKAIEFFEFDCAIIDRDVIHKNEYIEGSRSDDGYVNKEKSIGIFLRGNKVYSIVAGVDGYYR